MAIVTLLEPTNMTTFPADIPASTFTSSTSIEVGDSEFSRGYVYCSGTFQVIEISAEGTITTAFVDASDNSSFPNLEIHTSYFMTQQFFNNTVKGGNILAFVEALLSGSDTITGSSGNDTILGYASNDILKGGAGADRLDGGDGTDAADYSSSSAAVTVNLTVNSGSGGDAEGDTFNAIEIVTGSRFADTLAGDGNANILAGGAGTDTLVGGAGNDTLRGGAGADILNGGANSADTASYLGSSAAVIVNLGTGARSGGDAAGDSYVGIESLSGSSFGDGLTGDAGANGLRGEAGNDLLNGGAGNDTLVGGTGRDTFYFTPGTGKDRILDFTDTAANSSEDDVLNLTGYNFASADAALAGKTAVGADLVLKLSSSDSVTLAGYLSGHTLADLTAQDIVI